MYRGMGTEPEMTLISMQKIRRYARKGCEVYVCLVQDVKVEEIGFDQIPVVRAFSDVFSRRNSRNTTSERGRFHY